MTNTPSAKVVFHGHNIGGEGQVRGRTVLLQARVGWESRPVPHQTRNRDVILQPHDGERE